MDKTTVHGKDVRTYIAGIDLTGDSMESAWARSIDTAKRPRRGQDRVGYLTGHEGGKWTVGGYVPRAAATGLEARLANLPSSRMVCLEQFGDSGRGKFGTILAAGLDLGTPAEDKASIKGDLQVTGGIRACDMLLASVKIDEDSTSGTAKDGAAASDRGGSACLQVYNFAVVAHDAMVQSVALAVVTLAAAADAAKFTAGSYMRFGAQVRRVSSVAGAAVTLASAFNPQPSANDSVTKMYDGPVSAEVHDGGNGRTATSFNVDNIKGASNIKVGDYIRIGNEVRRVTAAAGGFDLTVAPGFTNVPADDAAVRVMVDTPTMFATVEHSTNNADWTTLVDFGHITDEVAEVKEVASTTSINRYVRARVTRHGESGACKMAVGFERR